MKNDFIFTFTDKLTKKSVSHIASYRGYDIQKFVIKSVEKLFKESVEDELKAYFGETDVQIQNALDGSLVCTAVLTSNVFCGHTDATYKFC